MKHNTAVCPNDYRAAYRKETQMADVRRPRIKWAKEWLKTTKSLYINGEWVEVRLWSDVQEGVRAAVSESAPASPGGVYRVWMQVGATRNGRFQYKYVMSPEKTA